MIKPVSGVVVDDHLVNDEEAMCRRVPALQQPCQRRVLIKVGGEVAKREETAIERLRLELLG